ncbi:MAG: hypothetical protein WCJ84_06305 [Candidatus Peregrinibacteria bacterium]
MRAFSNFFLTYGFRISTPHYLPLRPRTPDNKDRAALGSAIPEAISNLQGITFSQIAKDGGSAVFEYSAETEPQNIPQIEQKIQRRLQEAGIIMPPISPSSNIPLTANGSGMPSGKAELQKKGRNVPPEEPKCAIKFSAKQINIPQEIGGKILRLLLQNAGNIIVVANKLKPQGYRFGDNNDIITHEMIANAIAKVPFTFQAKNGDEKANEGLPDISDKIKRYLQTAPFTLESVCEKLKEEGYTGEYWNDPITPLMIVNAFAKAEI